MTPCYLFFSKIFQQFKGYAFTRLVVYINCDPPRKNGRKLQIFKIDLFSWFINSVLPVSLTEGVLYFEDLYYFLFYRICIILNLITLYVIIKIKF